MALADSYHLLIDTIKRIDEVISIGKSGGQTIPTPNESDIDIFIFLQSNTECNNKANRPYEIRTGCFRNENSCGLQ